MVAIIILSAGLVAIYRSFLLGADLNEHLANRLYALNLLESRSAFIEKELRSLHAADVSSSGGEEGYGVRPVSFQLSAVLKPVGTLLSVFQLDLSVSWQERERMFTLSRSAYFSGLSSFNNTGAQ
jgi:type II secretory pathway component PulJ